MVEAERTAVRVVAQERVAVDNGVPDDLDGNDTPAGLSSFNDSNFDPSTIADDKTALASSNFNDTFLCPFMTVLHVPSGAAEDWARAFGRVTKDLVDACALPLADPTRRGEIVLASKWYSGLPQIILRSPGRGHIKDTKIVKLRLHQFINGNFKVLVQHWVHDVQKQHARTRKPRNDTIEARTARAVKDIFGGDISRGLRITAVLPSTPNQAADEGQAPCNSWSNLAVIPEEWIGELDMNLSGLKKIAWSDS
jgi:hypothetical protein